MKAVIFDLDGTLINSSIHFKKMKFEIIQYLEEVGVEPGLLNDRMLNFEITNSALEYLRQKGFSDEETRRVLSKIAEIMNRVELESLNDAALVEGVSETLKALKSKGLKLGIMTRSCREYAEKVLEKFGLSEYFDAVVARDDVEKPKPDPEHAFHLLRLLSVSAEDALFVGDHWSDAECAKKVRLNFLLIKRRGQDVEALKEFDCQAIERMEDIVELVEAAQ